MTNTNTSDKQQKVSINPNPTMVSLTDQEEQNAELEMAKLQITTLKSERDTIAGTVNSLDKELAQLKDRYQAEQQKNENMFKSFEELYNKYLGLCEHISSTVAANAITTGKLAEALVRHKFTIPEVTNPS